LTYQYFVVQTMRKNRERVSLRDPASEEVLHSRAITTFIFACPSPNDNARWVTYIQVFIVVSDTSKHSEDRPDAR
jgi:hypothetical protein